jgi:hypothetical protein
MIYPEKKFINRNEWARSIGSAYQNATVVEVGVWRGEFGLELMAAFPGCNYVGVDPYALYENYTDKPGHEFNGQDQLDSLYNRVLHLVESQGGTLLRDFSVSAAKTFNDRSIDVVYLDGDHKYQAVSADIQAWWPKIRSGGILAGHDYIERSHVEEFGVIPAVQEFLAREGIEIFYITGEPYATWWTVKQ